MATRLDVMIATVGRRDLLRATLTSLAACRKPATYYQTVVMEKGPKAGAEEVVKSFHASRKITQCGGYKLALKLDVWLYIKPPTQDQNLFKQFSRVSEITAGKFRYFSS